MDDQKELMYTTDNSGLLSNHIADLAMNDQSLWIATDAGIAKYDLSPQPTVALDD